MHISPGMSYYNKGNPDWDEEAIIVFNEIIRSYQSKISYIFAGHYHSGYFQLVQGTQLPILIHPSVSPCFGNNPGFRYYSVSNIDSDYIDYTYNLNQTVPTWYPRSFSQMYNIPNLNFTDVFNKISQNSTLFDAFIKRAIGFDVVSGVSNQVAWKTMLGLDYNTQQSLGRSIVLCDIKNFLTKDFLKCVESASSNLRGSRH